METLLSCPVCEKTDFISLFSCKDYVASGDFFKILECKNCSFRFTNPRPDLNEIGHYYESEKYISHTGNKTGIIYQLYNLIRDYSIKQKLKHLKKYHRSGKLLDIGCGLGYFLNGVVKDNSFAATGIDTSDTAAKYVKERFGIEIKNEQTLNIFPKNNFDIITMWHVLEHVHNLDERMEQLKRLLKSGGTLFIAVPNVDSWDAKYFAENWDAYDVPRHLYHFNQNSFKVLMEKYGFNIVETRAMIFDAPYVSMRSVVHKNWSFAFFFGGVLGVISNIMAWKNKNYSSLLFVVKNV